MVVMKRKKVCWERVKTRLQEGEHKTGEKKELWVKSYDGLGASDLHTKKCSLFLFTYSPRGHAVCYYTIL